MAMALSYVWNGLSLFSRSQVALLDKALGLGDMFGMAMSDSFTALSSFSVGTLPVPRTNGVDDGTVASFIKSGLKYVYLIFFLTLGLFCLVHYAYRRRCQNKQKDMEEKKLQQQQQQVQLLLSDTTEKGCQTSRSTDLTSEDDGQSWSNKADTVCSNVVKQKWPRLRMRTKRGSSLEKRKSPVTACSDNMSSFSARKGRTPKLSFKSRPYVVNNVDKSPKSTKRNTSKTRRYRLRKADVAVPEPDMASIQNHLTNMRIKSIPYITNCRRKQQQQLSVSPQKTVKKTVRKRKEGSKSPSRDTTPKNISLSKKSRRVGKKLSSNASRDVQNIRSRYRFDTSSKRSVSTDPKRCKTCKKIRPNGDVPSSEYATTQNYRACSFHGNANSLFCFKPDGIGARPLIRNRLDEMSRCSSAVSAVLKHPNNKGSDGEDTNMNKTLLRQQEAEKMLARVNKLNMANLTSGNNLHLSTTSADLGPSQNPLLKRMNHQNSAEQDARKRDYIEHHIQPHEQKQHQVGQLQQHQHHPLQTEEHPPVPQQLTFVKKQLPVKEIFQGDPDGGDGQRRVNNELIMNGKLFPDKDGRNTNTTNLGSYPNGNNSIVYGSMLYSNNKSQDNTNDRLNMEMIDRKYKTLQGIREKRNQGVVPILHKFSQFQRHDVQSSTHYKQNQHRTIDENDSRTKQMGFQLRSIGLGTESNQKQQQEQQQQQHWLSTRNQNQRQHTDQQQHRNGNTAACYNNQACSTRYLDFSFNQNPLSVDNEYLRMNTSLQLHTDSFNGRESRSLRKTSKKRSNTNKRPSTIKRLASKHDLIRLDHALSKHCNLIKQDITSIRNDSCMDSKSQDTSHVKRSTAIKTDTQYSDNKYTIQKKSNKWKCRHEPYSKHSTTKSNSKTHSKDPSDFTSTLDMIHTSGAKNTSTSRQLNVGFTSTLRSVKELTSDNEVLHSRTESTDQTLTTAMDPFSDTLTSTNSPLNKNNCSPSRLPKSSVKKLLAKTEHKFQERRSLFAKPEENPLGEINQTSNHPVKTKQSTPQFQSIRQADAQLPEVNPLTKQTGERSHTAMPKSKLGLSQNGSSLRVVQKKLRTISLSKKGPKIHASPKQRFPSTPPSRGRTPKSNRRHNMLAPHTPPTTDSWESDEGIKPTAWFSHGQPVSLGIQTSKTSLRNTETQTTPPELCVKIDKTETNEAILIPVAPQQKHMKNSGLEKLHQTDINDTEPDNRADRHQRQRSMSCIEGELPVEKTSDETLQNSSPPIEQYSPRTPEKQTNDIRRKERLVEQARTSARERRLTLQQRSSSCSRTGLSSCGSSPVSVLIGRPRWEDANIDEVDRRVERALKLRQELQKHKVEKSDSSRQDTHSTNDPQIKSSSLCLDKQSQRHQSHNLAGNDGFQIPDATLKNRQTFAHSETGNRSTAYNTDLLDANTYQDLNRGKSSTRYSRHYDTPMVGSRLQNDSMAQHNVLNSSNSNRPFRQDNSINVTDVSLSASSDTYDRTQPFNPQRLESADLQTSTSFAIGVTHNSTWNQSMKLSKHEPLNPTQLSTQDTRSRSEAGLPDQSQSFIQDLKNEMISSINVRAASTSVLNELNQSEVTDQQTNLAESEVMKSATATATRDDKNSPPIKISKMENAIQSEYPRLVGELVQALPHVPLSSFVEWFIETSNPSQFAPSEVSTSPEIKHVRIESKQTSSVSASTEDERPPTLIKVSQRNEAVCKNKTELSGNTHVLTTPDRFNPTTTNSEHSGGLVVTPCETPNSASSAFDPNERVAAGNNQQQNNNITLPMSETRAELMKNDSKSSLVDNELSSVSENDITLSDAREGGNSSCSERRNKDRRDSRRRHLRHLKIQGGEETI